MNTADFLQTLYTKHNTHRGQYFITMEEKRGPFLQTVVGTGKRVLDIGCRDGALTRYFWQGNQVVGIDIDLEALSRAKALLPNLETIHADLNGPWPIQSKSFDAVVAAEVLEHIYHPDLVVSKVAATLTDTGLFTGSIPYAYSVQSKIRYVFGIKRHTPLQDPTHINHFTRKEFVSILKKYFHNVSVTPVVSRKFKLFSFLLPNSFAHMFLFIAKNPKNK